MTLTIKNGKFSHVFFILIVIFLLNSCERKGCIPADTVGNDFVVTIPAKPDAKDFKSDSKENGGGLNTVPQTVSWIDTKFLANGEDIIAKVSGQYSSWMGLDEDSIVRDQDLSSERICSPIDDTDNIGDFHQVGYKKPKDLIRKTPPDTEHYKKAKAYYDKMIEEDKSEEQINRAKRDLSLAKNDKYGLPCWNINGYGVYILLKDPDNPIGPNHTLYEINNPSNPVSHMYYDLDENGFGQYDSSKMEFYNNTGSKAPIKKKSRIYIKIKDDYYSDNIGEVEIRFQHGVMADDEKFKLFDFISKKIHSTLELITEKLFTHIVEQPGYRSFILACLTLYISLTALSYLLGMAQLNVGDILMRIVKIIIIIMFLTPNAWDFFTSYLLNFYLHGIDEVIGLVASHANPQGSYDPDSPFNFLDRFFIGFFSEDVWIKIGSMFAIDIVAFVWVLLMMLMILMFLYVCMYALLIYLTSVTVIAIVIIVMPFIFVTMLFPLLKPMIDGWFSILLSYSLQAIMTFLLVSIFIALITTELYKSIGYPVCNNLIARISIFSGIIGKPESFTPGHDYLTWNWDLFPFFDVAQAGIEDREVDGTTGTAFFANWVVGGGQYNNKMITIQENMSKIKVPPYYKDPEELRYIHLPFLDPNNESDALRIKNIFEKGQILDLGSTVVAFLICYTMVVLRSSILLIAQHLSGASMLSGLAGEAKWVNSLSSMPGALWTQYVGSKMGEKIDKVHRFTARLTDPISGGKTVASLSNKMLKDHRAYKHVNMMRNRSGIIVNTVKKTASAPNEVVPKALDMFDGGLMSSSNIKTGNFTDHFADLKPKNIKSALGDDLKYPYFNERDSILDEFIANKKASIFEKDLQSKIDEQIEEGERDAEKNNPQRSAFNVEDAMKQTEQDIKNIYEQEDERRRNITDKPIVTPDAGQDDESVKNDSPPPATPDVTGGNDSSRDNPPPATPDVPGGDDSSRDSPPHATSDIPGGDDSSRDNPPPATSDIPGGDDENNDNRRGGGAQ